MAETKSAAKFVCHPLRPLVEWLEKADLPKPVTGRPAEPALSFTLRGAALFVSSLVMEHGEAKVVEMDHAEVIEIARRLRADRPHVWPAMRLGDFVRLVHRDKGRPEPRPTVGDLQGLVDRILTDAPMAFRPFVPPKMIPVSA